MKLRSRVWQILEPSEQEDVVSRWFDIFILTLIMLNVLAVMLGSVDRLYERHSQLFEWFELLSVIVFTVEYMGRLWSCVTRSEYRRSLTGRLRFFFTPLALVDLVAVLPFYLAFLPLDLRFLRALRLARIFRIAKFGRYSATLQLFGRVFRARKEELVITGAVIVVLVIITSSLMYYAEREVQPDRFPDIPSTMWWSIVTLTTVGYGDSYPVTYLGKLCAAVTAVLGIGLFALPTGILGAGFLDEMQKRRRRRSCPHCGKELD